MLKPLKHIIYSCLLALLLMTPIAALNFKTTYKLVTTQTEFTAGTPIRLEFLNTSTTPPPSLYVSTSFGSTLIDPEILEGRLHYTLPEYLASRAGIIHWSLLAKTTPLHGQLNILPQQTVNTIQTYLGPPSITAGGNDYTMLVAIPTDAYDNPLADATKVAIKRRFLNQQRIDTTTMLHGMSYKNIFSPIKTGRILMSSSCYNFNSKEYDVAIMPAPPRNFEITYDRHHSFADGNQITTFTTSIIKDQYGNVTSDGTYVDFFLKTKANTILKTSGTTINGVAVAKMIHPNHEDTWSVKAFVEGMAESNTIRVAYKAVILDFSIERSQSNRNITVGPLISFMEQMIPDGLNVTLKVFKNEQLIETLHKGTSKGYVHFKLNPNQFPKGNYTFKVNAAGITKTLNAITIW